MVFTRRVGWVLVSTRRFVFDLVEDARAAKSSANRFAAAGHARVPGREPLQPGDNFVRRTQSASARKGNLLLGLFTGYLLRDS